MRKRKRKNSNNDIQRIRHDLFPRWQNGEDVSQELEEIFERNPQYKHNPPASIGKMAYIDWKPFSGHSIVYRDKHGIIGNCECGYYPPKKE